MRLSLLLAAALAVFFVPIGAHAATLQKTVQYHTSYHETHPMPSGGAYTGRMTLRFYSDGSITGTYRNEFQAGILPVSGGVDGARIWFSIGIRNSRHVEGTIGKGGVITGTLTNWVGPDVFEFTAEPSTS